MTYPAFRCNECSLVRCTVPDKVCDECLLNMGYNKLTPSVSNGIFTITLSAPPKPSFVGVPPGYHLSGFLTACVAEGPGTLHCVASTMGGGSIRMFDGNTNSASSPQLYSQMVNHAMIFEWLNTPSMLTAQRKDVQIPFKSGLTVAVYNGDFALRFSDVLGNMYLIPY